MSPAAGLAEVAVVSVRTQARLLLLRPGSLAPLLVNPLYVVVLFGVVAAHRPSATLLTTLGLTAFVMAAWGHAMFTASHVIDEERFSGTLEINLTAPTGYLTSLVVRILTVTLAAAPVIAEVAAIGWLVHGTGLVVRDPVQFGLAVLVCLVGCAASALLLSGLLLLVRGARTLQNALTYPFYLLAGLVLPHSELPEGIRQLSDLFFLTWAVKGLRAAASGAAGGWTDLALATALAVAQAAVGVLVLRRVVQRLRRGEVSLHG
ncbi:ABC transporter permease [Umezawaea tangerina]|uniref:ABC-2 type transport system permease protein n=1 Tax=Umezawaea tangerina TaxID=84725 RepID=A0A2T0SVU6_9PSEU|nr:ABC transporter permease [Umezawaea tangerina]PRY37528.1 ABC-2 type transport system permease protein [Umezawaea tangerina]